LCTPTRIATDIYETATITVATTVTDKKEIKVYITGKEADPDWEIRPVRSIDISGGVATIVITSWQLIDPDSKAWTPNTSNSFQGIRVDMGDASPFVTTVDVFREYNDRINPSAKLYWEPRDSDFTDLTPDYDDPMLYTVQSGWSIVKNFEEGIIAPVPATYSTDRSRWERAVAYFGYREPDLVKIWYQAGERSNAYIRGYTLDPLSDFWAVTIAMLATAKLEREICACNNAAALAAHWRTDTALSGQDYSFMSNFDQLANPFGTKIGELEAWRRVHAFNVRKFDAGLI
jgi:hypothetical protein